MLCPFPKFRTFHLGVQGLRLQGDYLISNSLVTPKTEFMVIKDPLIFKCLCISIIQFSFVLFFFLLSTEKQGLPHPLHPSIWLLLLFVFTRILFLCDSLTWWGPPWGDIPQADNALPLSWQAATPLCWLSTGPGGTCSIPRKRPQPLTNTHRTTPHWEGNQLLLGGQVRPQVSSHFFVIVVWLFFFF